MSETAYWLALTRIRGLGSKGIQALLAHFGTAKAAWDASPQDLAQVRRLLPKQQQAIIRGRAEIDPQAEVARVAAVGAKVLTWNDSAYPLLLRRIADPPAVLFLLGELTPADQQAIAIVGARSASIQGQEVARRLAAALASRGITVVSGLARGIDAAAHRGALTCGGRTLAVLGCGIGSCYPPKHQKLAQEIRAQGALLSEYPPGTKPLAGNFPARNRIISGLALGVVVVEAGLRSGALITANFALEQGRELFAVPGDILREGTQGSNGLLKQGAKLVERVEDILEELPGLHSRPKQQELRFEVPLSASEQVLLELIKQGPTHTDTLVRASGLTVGEVESTLLKLELKGQVCRFPGGFFLINT